MFLTFLRLKRTPSQHPSSVGSVMWASNDKRFVSVSGTSYTISEQQSGKLWFACDHKEPLTACIWHPTQEMLACSLASGGVLVGAPREACARIQTSSRRAVGLGWNPVGSVLATAGPGLALWQLNSSKAYEKKASFDTQGAATCLTWCPDGRYVAVGNNDGCVLVFEVESSKLQIVLRASTKPVKRMVWSPDGRKIACLFEQSKGVCVYEFENFENLEEVSDVLRLEFVQSTQDMLSVDCKVMMITI